MLLNEDQCAQIEAVLGAAMSRYALPGLGVGIAHQGQLLYAKGMGLAEISTSRPVTVDTVFRVGSISKTLTAIGIMQLWEQGFFQLDHPVNAYLKGYRVEHSDSKAPAVTFRHLLTHTSGVGTLRRRSDMLHLDGRFTVNEGERLPTLPEYYAPILRAEVYPGTKWAYTNHGFATLGQLVEDISGQPFAEYMIEHVFDPLGMAHTAYRRSERVRDRLAVGYARRRGTLRLVTSKEIIPGPAGSVFSSVADMTRYLAALTQAECHGIIKSETLRLMTTRQFGYDDRLTCMGLGFMLGRSAGQSIVKHEGGVPGFSSSLIVAPDEGIGVIVLANSYNPIVTSLCADMLHNALGLSEPPLGALDAESPRLWPALCGSYGPQRGLLTNLRTLPQWGNEAEVVVKDGRLAVRSLWPVGPFGKGLRLYQTDPDDPFYFQANVLGREVAFLFQRGRTGDIDTLHIGGLVTFSKRSWLRSWRLLLRAGMGALAALMAVALALRSPRGHRAIATLAAVRPRGRPGRATGAH